MIEIKGCLENIVLNGSEDKKLELIEVVEEIVEHSCKPFEAEVSIYKINNGSHFNKKTLAKALSYIGGAKLSCDEIAEMLTRVGLDKGDATIEDISYALHMFYSDYGHLGFSDSQALKWAVAYCNDEDYPIRGGKCFDEWTHKVWVMKNLEHKK